MYIHIHAYVHVNMIIQAAQQLLQETLESFNEDLAQQLLTAILPASGHSVVVAMRPKGGKVGSVETIFWGIPGGNTRVKAKNFKRDSERN